MAHYDDSVIFELSIIFSIIAIASVIFRFEARRIKRLKLEADDWTVLAALVNLCLPSIEFALPLADAHRSLTLVLQFLSSSVRLYVATLQTQVS